MQSTRRDWFKAAGLGAVALAAGKAFGQEQSAKAETLTAKKPGFKLGLASYTTRKLDIDKTIAIAKRLDLECLSVKQDFHLPMTKPADEQKAIAQKIRDAGLDFYACGVIYMKTEEEVKKAFEFAKTVGVREIVGVPNHELLDITEACCKEYDIMIAIHNHGPTDRLYPSATSAYEMIKNRDKRMGVCIDLGHTQRCGIDPAEEILKTTDRLIDFHFKDVTSSDAKGSTVEMGRGVVDIPKVLRTLEKIGYNKNAAFEYEKDENDPLPGLAETVGYLRGVQRVLLG